MSTNEPARVVSTPGASGGRGLQIGEQLAVFVDRIAHGAEPGDAARLAGYDRPDATAVDLLRLPEVRKALASTIEGRLLSEHAPLALKVAAEILRDEKAPASIRGKMAVAVLDRVRDKGAEPGGGAAGLANLTQGDLAALVERLESSGAVVVPRNVTPRPVA